MVGMGGEEVNIARGCLGLLENALGYQVDFLYGNLAWLCALNPNFWANFTHADRPDQPNLYFWEKISRWANLANFHPIWFKFGTEVICEPLIYNRAFYLRRVVACPRPLYQIWTKLDEN